MLCVCVCFNQRIRMAVNQTSAVNTARLRVSALLSLAAL